MQADSLSQVADELYGLVPAEFTAARDEHARQARSAGQRQLSSEIRKLGRPTASAWLVNQLVRAAADQMGRLFEVGQALQEAQRELAGDRMRELAGQRRQVIADLVPAASRLAKDAGQPASATVLGEVRSTLEAAVADPAAGEAVRSGRLTRALAYAGLGEVDLTAAMAVPPAAAARQKSGRPATRAEGGPRDRAARAEEAVASAEAAADTADAAVAQAERTITNVAQQRQFLRRRIEHMERELKQAQTEDAQLARDAKQADRDLDAAGKALSAAKRRLAQARERASSS